MPVSRKGPRPAPAVTRNGYPERRNYTYRGTGEDTMPDAITDDDSTDYAHKQVYARWACQRCGHDRRSRKHRKACGEKTAAPASPAASG